MRLCDLPNSRKPDPVPPGLVVKTEQTSSPYSEMLAFVRNPHIQIGILRDTQSSPPPVFLHSVRRIVTRLISIAPVGRHPSITTSASSTCNFTRVQLCHTRQSIHELHWRKLRRGQPGQPRISRINRPALVRERMMPNPCRMSSSSAAPGPVCDSGGAADRLQPLSGSAHRLNRRQRIIQFVPQNANQPLPSLSFFVPQARLKSLSTSR